MFLRKYLKDNKIKYRDFAEKLGIPEQSLKNISCGTQRPGLKLALKIEELTSGNVTPSQLVKDFEEYSTKSIIN